jgi:membrane protease YdiL (CAAX protease family)
MSATSDDPLRKWKWLEVLRFQAKICVLSWPFYVIASVAPQIVISIPKDGLSVNSTTVLIVLSTFVPAAFLTIFFRKTRQPLLRFKAPGFAYALAVLLGFSLPFAGYLGSDHSNPLFSSSSITTMLRVFVINIFLSPLCEEIIWRAYFYRNVALRLSTNFAIVVGAAGGAIWHLGYLYFLYEAGFKLAIVLLLLIHYFILGIIFCSLFTLSHESLAPCVLLHAAYNASVAAYFGAYGRISDIGSYLALMLTSVLVASTMFLVVVRSSFGKSAEALNRDG